MKPALKDSLPSDLVTHVMAMCGNAGARWIDDLEDIVADVESLWSIKVGEPFPAGEFNFVAPAIRTDEGPVVVKISPPFEKIEIFDEAAFLRNRNGNGAVNLLAEDPERFAILLEHALPGTNLAEIFTENKPAAVEPAIEVLRAIESQVPETAKNIPTLDQWFAGLLRFGQTRFPAEYAGKALEIYDRLSGHPDRTLYIHGDFHPGNVVSATRAPFLAIDPKGIIGHLGYDIAVFLNNFYWWQEAGSDVPSLLERAIDQFSHAFGLQATELRQWAFAQTVLGAWWNFEETPELYNNEVAKADIWDV